MTIAAVVPVIKYAGSSSPGTSGPFSLVKSGTPITFSSNSHIKVYRYDTTSDSAPTLLVENTDYTLTGGPTAGSITLTSPQTGLLTAERLLIYREQPTTQPLDLTSGGSFSAAALEARFDRLVEMIQENREKIGRAVKATTFGVDAIPDFNLAASLNKIAYIAGTEAAPVWAYHEFNAADLAAVIDALDDIGIVAADLNGADTIGIVATGIDDVGDVADWLAGDGVAGVSIALSTYTDLKAVVVTGLGAAAVRNVLGRTSAGDGAGGMFRWVPGNQSANVTKDPGEGIWVAPDSDPTGASGAWRRLFSGLIDAGWYGFSTSASAADNATAINRALGYLRSVFAGGDITAAGEPPSGISTGPGQFNVTSVNATKIRSKAWRWEAYGTQLNCATDMAVVVDLTHSRGYSIRNLVVKGDETTPPLRGFQTGYMDGATSSGDYVLDNCHTYGKFEQTAYYNGGSEEIVLLKCRFRNTNSAQSSYAGILDGMNLWGKYSAYLTPADGDHMAMAVTSVSAASTATVTTAVAHGLSVGEYVRFFDVSGSSNVDQADNLWQVASTPTSTTFTITGTNGSSGTGGYCWKAQPNSMVNNNIIETAFFKDNGGRAVWMSSNVQSFRMSGYIYTPNDDAVLVYFRPAFSTLTPYSNDFDVAFEGAALKSLFYLYLGESATNTWSIGNWKVKDHGPQNTEALFKTNATTAIFSFSGIDLDIAAFAGSSINVVDTTARYRMQGRISTRNSTAGVIGNIPEFYGDLIVQDPTLVTTLPEGSYRILSRDFDGSDSTTATFKGVHRFFGGQAAISGGIDNQASLRIGDGVIRTASATMADDSAVTIDLPGSNPAAILVLAGSGGSDINGVYYVRASGSPTSVALTSGGTPATLSTGIKTGTTGTDGVFTISPHTDGNVYLENRLGSSRTVSYTIISHV